MPDSQPVAPAASSVPLSPGTTLTVRLVKDPRPSVSYPATVLADDGAHLVVRAPFAGSADRDLGYTVFAAGDVFTEHFFRDRWYSVKEVRDAAGALKGWYCDVCRPAEVRDGVLSAADLDLDLWLSADRTVLLRLDEDEFAESGLTEREPATAARARRALDELEALARDGFAGLWAGLSVP